MDNDCAKLSGSHWAATTGLSVCEDSVTSSLWSGRTFYVWSWAVILMRGAARKQLDPLEIISSQ